MELWKSESSPAKQGLVTWTCVTLGLLLVYWLRDAVSHGAASPNNLAGFLLGLLLLGIGIAAFLTGGKQTVVIDPGKRLITVTDNTRFGARERLIRFDDIARVNVGFIGKRANFSRHYYLGLTLGSSEEYSLFAPGRFYPGCSDRAVVDGWRQRLEGYLARPSPHLTHNPRR